MVHFTLTNPEWKMPSDAHNFMNGLKKHAQQDLNRARQTGLMNTAMGQSLFSVGNLGGQVSDQGNKIRPNSFIPIESHIYDSCVSSVSLFSIHQLLIR